MAASAAQSGGDLLAVLLHLGRRARQAGDEAELGFILVNETFQLTPYRQAALWLRGESITTLSGVVMPEANAPYVQWLDGLCRHWDREEKTTPWVIRPADLPDGMVSEWSQWLPAEVVCVPVPRVGQRFSGGALILARDPGWSAGELALLGEWVSIWASARALIDKGGVLARLWQRVHGRPATTHATSRRISLKGWIKKPRVWFLALSALLLFAPVRLTVLAPAELVPLSPTLVRAPLDGVIEQVHVFPNQMVDVGTPLFEFDRTSIRNRLLIAERSADTVRAELR